MIAPRTTLPAGCALYFTNGSLPGAWERALQADGITLLPLDSLVPGEPEDARPAVLFVDHQLARNLSDLAALPAHVTIVAGDSDAETALDDAADLSIAAITDLPDQLRVLRAAFWLSACRKETAAARSELSRSRNELTELNRIGMALMTEHNHEVLLQQIVEQFMRLTCSDAGALFLLERPQGGPPRLRIKIMSTVSSSNMPILEDMTVAVDSTSVVGHVALTGEPLVLEDSHDLPHDAPYTVNMFVQEELGYWVKSMLTLPMVDHKRDVVGVLQLANRKRDPSARLNCLEDVEQHVIPFSERDVQLGLSLAGQAAVSIENVQLYAQIEHLFECFVKAAVTAIEQRDPTTSGHSIRVATLVTDLARAAERSGRGSYRSLHFTPAQMRELRYAALLHDFGKIGVREEVLIKGTKLPPAMWARLETRFDLIRCAMELEYERKRAASKESRPHAKKELVALDAEFKREQDQIERFWSAIRAANKPTVLPEDAAASLTDAARLSLARPHKTPVPFLTPDELHYLRIPQGSLDERERLEVQTHTTQTFLFLSQIPWTDDLKDIAGYAASHHEKLDGTGYPRRLTGEDIPVQTRIITIADIFDALTASDRPYKPSISADAALDIIKHEADSGLLDRDLVRVLIESQVYRHVIEEDWRSL